MKTLTLKSILAGTGLAAALTFAPAYAQDSAPQVETDVKTETTIETEVDVSTDMGLEIAPKTSTVVKPNDEVLGALETYEADTELEADNEDDWNEEFGAEGTDMDEDILVDDFEIDLDTQVEATPEIDVEDDFDADVLIDSETDVEVEVETDLEGDSDELPEIY